MSVDLQPYASHDSSLASLADPFPFLSLPIEIRLKIYKLLLPPRTHTIVTQLPNNGFFYNTALILNIHSSPFYPFGRSAPKNSTSYKVLTTNFRSSYPAPSIHPEILRTSKQIRHEAEPVLYGGKGVEWDFGIHLEALKSFWKDRSQLARDSIKYLRIAKEIPCMENRDGQLSKAVDEKWLDFNAFLRTELSGLKTVDLTIWSSSGLTSSFPSAARENDDLVQIVEKDVGHARRVMQIQDWREWGWTRDLLQLEELKRAKITWWGFQNIRDETNFDSWLAGRMVGDRLVRERMIREGVVVEGVIVVPGQDA